MDEILHQLGGLFLGSVPTIILFLVVLVSYRILVYGPLGRVLAERRERTLGAIERASAAARTADAKAQEYEARLRAARQELGRQRDLRVQQWNKERENILQDARHAASELLKEARTLLDRQSSDARETLNSNADQLAEQILRVVLPAASASAGSALEGAR